MSKDAMDPIHGWVVIAAFEMGGLMRGVVEHVMTAGYPVVVVDNGSTDSTFDEAVLGGALVLRQNTHGRSDCALEIGTRFARLRGAPHVYTFVLDGKEQSDSEADPDREAEYVPSFA
jgi:hypothetical protein